MKKLYFKNIVFSSLIILSMFMVSCGSTPPTPKRDNAGAKNLKVNSVSWMIENLDPSIWNGKPKGNSQMFVSFYISYSGTFDINLIKNIIIESPIDLWTLNTSQIESVLEIRADKNIAILKRLQCGNGLGAAPLGEWNFLVNENSGGKYEQKLLITAFENKEEKADLNEPIGEIENNKEENAIKTLVPNSKNKNEIEALALPVIVSVSKDEDTIEIYFKVNDSRIKNGYFWFDVPGEKYYRDSGSMIDASGSPVNGCREFYIDGKKSRYILRKNDENAEWFDKIVACFFVVSDTNRVASPWEERVRTVSAKAPVK